MFQDKTQTAENGWSFSRAATQYWSIWLPPCGRAGKHSSVAAHPLGKDQAITCEVRLTVKHFPAR